MSSAAESVASIAVGSAAAAFGDPGGALQAGTTLAGLAARVIAGGEAEEHARVLKRVAAALAERVAAAPEAERADMRAAEAVIVREAPALMLDRAAMAACAAGDFEATAAAHLMARLGLTARDFTPRALDHAERLLRAGLAAAKQNEGFYRRLSLDVLLDLRADTAATRAMVETLLKERVVEAEARRLLENLALRFGHDNPNAPPSELETFLREKAKDYAAMRARLDALAAADGRIANLMGAAEAALAAGDFDEADARLADAEAMQQAEHTLVQVRKQAGLRVARGRAALLKGDAEAAAAHAEAAAGFFAPFDPLEGARVRNAEAEALCDHGRRFGGGGLAGAAKLWRDNLSIVARDKHPMHWAVTQNNLGTAFSEQGERTDGPEGAQLLRKAIDAYRSAQEVYNRSAFPENWANAQNNLAVALAAMGKRTDGSEGVRLLDEAVAAYRAALTIRTLAVHPLDWAVTQNNLAAALLTQGERTAGAKGARLLGEAVESFRAALEVTTRVDHPTAWAMTHHNLGTALFMQGERTGDVMGMELLGAAVEAYRAALEVRTRDEHPMDWAATQRNLAAALSEQGQRTGGAEGAQLLGAAVGAFRSVLEMLTLADHSVDWAATHHNLGGAFQALGDLGEDSAARYAAALAAVDAALEVFDPAHMAFDHAKATRMRARIAGKLAALNDDG